MPDPGRSWRRALPLAILAALTGPPAGAQDSLAVLSATPTPRALTAPVGTSITIRFDRPVLRSSVTPASFWAFGRWSGVAAGSFRFGDGDRTVTLDPGRSFSAGESVMVILSNALEAQDGASLRAAGYSFQFWTRSRGSGFDFVEIDRFSTRTDPSVSTRSYGGFGSDLNGDGFLDLTIVNEDTSDLRTYMNRGDRSGLLHDRLDPPAPTDLVPSPSEPGDFNRDGNVDVAVANVVGGSVSIVLGNGDGTFEATQTVPVGIEARGVAVLDADGDGDMDVAATAFQDGTVTVLFNDGSGRFGSPSSFGTGSGERAVAAGDMDGDGVLDLVVGALTSQEVHVYLGRGDGTFRLASRRGSGGETWMLALGDVNGDSTEDVVVVNSATDNGAVLAGDGNGRLRRARTMATDPFPLATDLADLDGDGDLDWITSSFFGNWMVFENDGNGDFAFLESFTAPQAASCSIPMDLDRDGVLDLVLIDELEDEVVLLTSRTGGFESDFESGDTSEWSRARGAVAVVAPGLSGTGHALEVAVDGTRGRSYVESRHPATAESWSVSFDLNANRVALAGSELEILRLGAARKHVTLTLVRSGGRYEVRLDARDGAALRRIGEVLVPAARTVRVGVEWASAISGGSAEGRAALLKGGRVRAVASDLANSGQVVKKVRLGLPAGSKGAASGSFLVDEYVSEP